jgi:hypothetical protein
MVDIADITPQGSPESVRRVMEWGMRLHLVRASQAETFELDPVVQRLLETVGEQ